MKLLRWRRATGLLLAVLGALGTAALAPEVGPAQGAAPLPGFTLLSRGPSGGTVWLGKIPGATAGAAGRASLVYLPPGFSPRTRYPVVYLLHGMPGSPLEYADSLKLATVGDRLATASRPFIAAVPVAGSSWHYDGEWTGPWEDYVVDRVVPWIDAHLPTIPAASGRVLAGLSAGGYGAVDIGLRHPSLFGLVESWSGYFEPLRDGTLAQAGPAELEAHDPVALARSEAPKLRALGLRFELSTGPGHGQVKRASTTAFAAELHSLGLPVSLWMVPAAQSKTPYYPQFVRGLRFALGAQ